ncbi:AraC family transcriptional regulator [Taklimakanibacter deserti]|uniref:AraC family transcriptional regulator n=1 Tax=Taklimakanibacter deserti TaxID=2267839 RepID=UPI000E6525A7
MDALSEALRSVRMTGAIFYHAECTAPWGFRVPHVKDVAHVLAPGTERLVSYHLVTEGNAIVGFPDAAIPVAAGDVLIIPHGDAHTVSNGSPSTFIDSGSTLDKFLAGDLKTMRLGGGGEMTRFVCGYFGCEKHADRLFLAGLPLMIKVSIRGDAAGEWLEHSVRHLVSESGSGRPGQSVLLSKMAEALFIETLRRYMEQLPAEQTGWLAGARDAVVGGALALMHARPFQHWTLAGLAQEAGASRSVLAQRFQLYLDESPLAYLARWRLQLAARLLQTTRQPVLQIAMHVGYESEAAFNRAFKREFSTAPGQFRKAMPPGGDSQRSSGIPARRAGAAGMRDAPSRSLGTRRTSGSRAPS